MDVLFFLAVQGCAYSPPVVTDTLEPPTAAPLTSISPFVSAVPALPSDAPASETSIQEFRLTDVYPVPVGNEVYNNGGSVVQHGDCVYYFGVDSTEQQAVYVSRVGSDEAYKLYAAEGYVSQRFHSNLHS